jgi:hypothetical protein
MSGKMRSAILGSTRQARVVPSDTVLGVLKAIKTKLTKFLISQLINQWHHET